MAAARRRSELGTELGRGPRRRPLSPGQPLLLPAAALQPLHASRRVSTPVRAARSSKRAEDGIVLVDQDRCHGYRFCVEACPYKKVYFDTERQVATKCLFCLPRIEQGVAPACARQCPGRLRFVGYLDDAAGPIWKLVATSGRWRCRCIPSTGSSRTCSTCRRSARRRSTRRAGRRARRAFPSRCLEGLFGPPVRAALATLAGRAREAQRGEPSELMDLLDRLRLERHVQARRAAPARWCGRTPREARGEARRGTDRHAARWLCPQGVCGPERGADAEPRDRSPAEDGHLAASGCAGRAPIPCATSARSRGGLPTAPRCSHRRRRSPWITMGAPDRRQACSGGRTPSGLSRCERTASEAWSAARRRTAGATTRHGDGEWKVS